MKLSILIPTLECRATYLARLFAILEPQLVEGVEVKTLRDNGERCTGAKRNELVASAKGEYVAFVDDDDRISDDYVASILTALEEGPDVVGFKLVRYQEGQRIGEESMSLRNGDGYDIDRSDERNLIFRYPPTHLCPVRAELAREVQFKEWNTGEDKEWQDRLRPLLMTEVFVDRVLYHYEYRANRKEMTNRIRTWKR